MKTSNNTTILRILTGLLFLFMGLILYSFANAETGTFQSTNGEHEIEQANTSSEGVEGNNESDEVDNDEDGLVDMYDPRGESEEDNDESNAVVDSKNLTPAFRPGIYGTV